MASLFADTYQSSQPLHPARGFTGHAQVLKNWMSVFEGVPDFSVELVASAVDGPVEWGALSAVRLTRRASPTRHSASRFVGLTCELIEDTTFALHLQRIQ